MMSWWSTIPGIVVPYSWMTCDWLSYFPSVCPISHGIKSEFDINGPEREAQYFAKVKNRILSRTHKNTIIYLQGNTHHCWGNDREEALVTILGHNLWYLVISIIVQNNITNHRSQCQYPSRCSKRNIPSLNVQCQYPSQRSKRKHPLSISIMTW